MQSTEERPASTSNGLHLHRGRSPFAAGGVGLLAMRPDGLMVPLVVFASSCWLVPRRPLHAAAEPGGAAAPLRQLPRHRSRARAALGQSVLLEAQDLGPRANFNSEKLKVNDLRGNPIEIAAAIVWRVDDTARGELRRRELRGLRADAGRVGGAPPRLSYAYDNFDEPARARPAR
jgi:hypothetical protein